MPDPQPTRDPMDTSSLYLAAAEPGTGKSALALGLVHLLAASAGRVGVFRPIVRSRDVPDELLTLLIAHTTAKIDDPAVCLGVTYQQVHQDPAAALGEIVAGYHAVAAQCDAVLVVGSDYSDVLDPAELAFNARVAANLDAPMLLAINGHDRDPDTVRAITERCLSELAAGYARPVAVIVNRCDPAQLITVRAALGRHRAAGVQCARGAAAGRADDGRTLRRAGRHPAQRGPRAAAA